MLILACFKTLTRFVILLSLCTAHAIWAMLFCREWVVVKHILNKILQKKNPGKKRDTKK